MKCLPSLAETIATVALASSFAALPHAASAQPGCSLEEASDYQTAVWVPTEISVLNHESPQARFNAVIASLNRFHMSEACAKQAGVEPPGDVDCQKINGAAFKQESGNFEVARYGIANQILDRQAFADYARDIWRRILTATPRACWFQWTSIQDAEVAAQTAPPTKPPDGGSARCAMLWSQYQSCKQEVEAALKRCAVTKPPCRDLGPTCLLPNC